MRSFFSFLLKISGWRREGIVPKENKFIIIGVPHTSAWDFVWSWVYSRSLGIKVNFLIKKEFFFWPIGSFLKRMGGVPIDRSKGANVIRQVIRAFEENDEMRLAITPEGTRKRTTRWKSGFHMIASKTGVPVYLGSFDWGRKVLAIHEKFKITEDASADIKRMKDFYREKGIKGKFPENFTTDY